jgi:hypothetical protein
VSLWEAEFLFGKHKSISAGSRESVQESECRGFLWEAKDLCEQRIFHIYEKQSIYRYGEQSVYLGNSVPLLEAETQRISEVS